MAFCWGIGNKTRCDQESWQALKFHFERIKKRWFQMSNGSPFNPWLTFHSMKYWLVNNRYPYNGLIESPMYSKQPGAPCLLVTAQILMDPWNNPPHPCWKCAFGASAACLVVWRTTCHNDTHQPERSILPNDFRPSLKRTPIFVQRNIPSKNIYLKKKTTASKEENKNIGSWRYVGGG